MYTVPLTVSRMMRWLSITWARFFSALHFSSMASEALKTMPALSRSAATAYTSPRFSPSMNVWYSARPAARPLLPFFLGISRYRYRYARRPSSLRFE